MLPEYSFFDPESITTRDSNEASLDAFSRGKLTTPHIKYDSLKYFKSLDVLDKSNPLNLSSEIIRFALELDNASKQNDHVNRIEYGRCFKEAGENKYGELSKQLFLDSLSPDLTVLSNFNPQNTYARMIKNDLENMLSGVNANAERPSSIDYESAKEGVLEYLKPLLDVVPREGRYSTAEVANFFIDGIGAMGLDSMGWGVEISETRSVLTTSSINKKIYIPENTKSFGVRDIERLMAHEIGIHASKSIKLSEEFEEGLAIAVEAILENPSEGEPTSIKRARKRYLHLGLALGADGKCNRNSRQVFEITWRLEALQKSYETGIISPEIEQSAKRATLGYIRNIFRGTDYRLPGVVYMRPKVYYEGFKKAAIYINKHSDNNMWLRSALHTSAVQENN